MQNYEENLVGRVSGALTPLLGVSITVKDDATGNAASLYSDDGVTPLDQPLTTDNEGHFAFYAPNGRYTLTFSGAQIATFSRSVELYDKDDAQPLTQAQAASPTGATNVGYGTDTVAGALDALHLADYTALRAYTGAQKSVYVTGYLATSAPSGIAGLFTRDDSDTTSADNGGTIIVASNGKRWKRSGVDYVSPLWFGAKWDGVANDTSALAAMSAVINAQGGGRIVLPPGTSIVGQQTLAGATGKGYSYLAADIIKITGCTKPVIIESHGAVLRVAAGLKFGAFDPVTGAPYVVTPPLTNQDYVANVGVIISATNNTGGVTVVGNLELDGNLAALTIGGPWGDAGYQCRAYGIEEYNNAFFSCANVYAHHNATDNITCGYNGAAAGDPKKPKTLINVVCDYAGRNNLSWIGGIGLTAINCKFTNAGRAVNTGTGSALASSPGAGVDIEAEGGVNRKGVFINCEFANNNGCGMVADSGDSADVDFIDCQFYGMTNYSAWPKKPRFSFTRCLFAGSLVNAYNASDEKDRTRFNQCVFSADETWNGTAAAYGSVLADVTGENAVFNQCQFSTKNASVKLQSSTTAIYTDCTFLQNGSTATANSIGEFRGRNVFTMTTGGNDLTGSANYGEILYNGGPLNLVQSSTSPSFGYLRVFGSNGGTWQTNTITSTYQKPTSGNATRGDMVMNNMPSVGGPDFWRCVTGGNPGTWVANKKRGTFTCAAAATTTVTDTDVQASSLILLMPKNAAAATLMGGATSLYVSARTAATSFVVATANGASAAGTEQFEYELLN